MERGATVAPAPGNLVRPQSATTWLVPLPLYLGVIVAFLLPFLSVECGDRETEDLTGMQLIRGDIEWVESSEPDNSLEQVNVERAISEFSAKARVALAFTIAATVLVIVIGFSSQPSGSLAALMVAVGMAVPLVFVPMFVGGWSFVTKAPSVHHHYGLYVATGLATLALITDVGVFIKSLRAGGNARALPVKLLVFGAILYVVAGGFVFLLAANSFDRDSRWEDTTSGTREQAGQV